MVHGESEVLAGCLRISRPLISIVTGCSKSDMWKEGNCFTIKDLAGWIQGLILTKNDEYFIFQACRAGALSEDKNHISPQAQSPATVRWKQTPLDKSMLYKNKDTILALYPSNLFLASQEFGTLTEKLEYLCLQIALAQTGMEGPHLECRWGCSIKGTGCFSTECKLKKLQKKSPVGMDGEGGLVTEYH